MRILVVGAMVTPFFRFQLAIATEEVGRPREGASDR